MNEPCTVSLDPYQLDQLHMSIREVFQVLGAMSEQLNMICHAIEGVSNVLRYRDICYQQDLLTPKDSTKNSFSSDSTSVFS